MGKPKTREEMIEFLASHFRYSTMNSWNGSSSWAANVKIQNLKIPNSLRNRAYELLDVAETFYPINGILKEFGRTHDWRYQIGFNGRSGGYLVLYRGERKLSEHKSYCQKCGQRNFTSTKETGTKCGRCGAAARVDHVFYDVSVWPGKGIGTADREELASMDTEELRAEVALVLEFDAAVEECRRAFLEMCRTTRVVEETIMVPKKVKRLAPSK